MTFTRSQDRAPHSQTTLEGPLFVEVRPGADLVVAWVDKENPYAYTSLGYRPVNPADVERMDGGQFYPHDKDIGMYRGFDKKDTEVRSGRVVLMYTTKTDRDARQKREAERLMKTSVRKTDPDEQTNVEEVVSTLGKELKNPTE